MFCNNYVLQAVRKRFASTLDSKEALLAAATLPRFKLRWMKWDEDERKDHAKTLLLAECRALPPVEEEPPAPVAAAAGEDEEEGDFFAFADEREDVSHSVDSEIADYFKSAREMDVLNKFPMIKKISLRLNTPTPSSAPVERLFSLGGQVLTPKRNRLSDARFERLVLLRYNHHFG